MSFPFRKTETNHVVILEFSKTTDIEFVYQDNKAYKYKTNYYTLNQTIRLCSFGRDRMMGEWNESSFTK